MNDAIRSWYTAYIRSHWDLHRVRHLVLTCVRFARLIETGATCWGREWGVGTWDEALRHVFAAVAQAERFVMAWERAEMEGSPANAKLTT